MNIVQKSIISTGSPQVKNAPLIDNLYLWMNCHEEYYIKIAHHNECIRSWKPCAVLQIHCLVVQYSTVRSYCYYAIMYCDIIVPTFSHNE